MATKKKLTPATGISFDEISSGQSSYGLDRETLAQRAQAVPPVLAAQPVQLTAANGFGSGVSNPYASEYDQLQIDRYNQSQKPINRDAIRKQKIAEFQAQIDATNQIFSNLTAQANVQGEGRLGQQRAISARSGNLQQPRGEAQKEQVITYNNQITGDIAARQNAAISAIMIEAQDRADAEYQAKVNAKELGAQAYLQYLGQAEERKSTNAQAVLQSLLAQGLTLEDIPQEQFGQIANSLKMTPQELQNVYRGELAKAAAAQEAAEYERFLKDREFGLEENKFGFEQDKFNAEYGLNVLKENNLNARESNKFALDQLKYNFDVTKFNQEFALNSRKAEAEIRKINNDIANGGANQPIDPEFAAKYGLPLGLTKGQLAGVIPGQQEKLDAAKSELLELDNINGLIETLKKGAPSLVSNTLGINIPRLLPGTNTNALKDKFNQLKAILSLDNAGKLKGSGAISDAERKLLADSVSSLNINSKPEAFIEELNRLQEKINISRQRVQNLQFNAQSNGLFQQFEGGSGGTNPKASYGSVNSYAKNTGNGRIVTGSSRHRGPEVDIDGKIGDPIPAFEGGKVIAIRDTGNKDYGKHVIVENSRGERVYYAHLNAFNVKVGQQIPTGYRIGEMGNTGAVVASKGGDGSHLHIEKRDRNGRVIALDSHHSHA